MWNTGLNNVGNALKKNKASLNVVDQENTGIAQIVTAKVSADFKSAMLPWCNSNEEVLKKAYKVVDMKTGKLIIYFFQNYQNNQLYWSLGSSKAPFDEKKHVRAGSDSNAQPLPAYPAVDLIICDNLVFGAATESKNDIFQTVLAGVLKMAEVGGAIAGAIGSGGEE